MPRQRLVWAGPRTTIKASTVSAVSQLLIEARLGHQRPSAGLPGHSGRARQRSSQRHRWGTAARGRRLRTAFSAARRRAASTELSPAMTEVIADVPVEAERARVSRPSRNIQHASVAASCDPFLREVSQPVWFVTSTLETAAGAAVVAETVAARRSARSSNSNVGSMIRQ